MIVIQKDQVHSFYHIEKNKAAHQNIFLFL